MNFLELAAARFSCRSFNPDKPVDSETLAGVLEAARLAPTAHNDQPYRIKVLTKPEDLTALDEFTPCRYGAPAAIIVSCDVSTAWKRPYDGVDSGVVDATIVATHIILGATELGLNTCWVMFFDPEKVKAKFGLADNLNPVAIIMAGYKTDDAEPSPFHSKRKEIAEITA
jgi:nitroreductase